MTDQPSLFGDLPPTPTGPIGGRANVTADGVYRYTLARDWHYPGDRALFVMLNPSAADATEDDPTIRRCMGFARQWGLDGIRVVNLYAYRATKPPVMFAAERDGVDIVGPENDHWITHMVLCTAGPVVAAWGANARADRVEEVLALPGMERAQCLGLTKDALPRHPLMLRGDTQLEDLR